MTKQNEKKSIRSQQGKGLSAVWLSVVAFAFGYLAASWFDVNQFVSLVDRLIHANPPKPIIVKEVEAELPHPKLEFYTLLTNEKLPTRLPKAEAQPSEHSSAENAEAQLVDTTQPLDLEITPAANPEMAAAASAAVPVERHPLKPKQSETVKLVANNLPPRPIIASGVYSIQVGSFRALQEAQRMKTKMAMKGLRVEIVSVAQQDVRWYRVMIGPFPTLTQARQAQQDFARRERINGMIRRTG